VYIGTRVFILSVNALSRIFFKLIVPRTTSLFVLWHVWAPESPEPMSEPKEMFGLSCLMRLRRINSSRTTIMQSQYTSQLILQENVGRTYPSCRETRPCRIEAKHETKYVLHICSFEPALTDRSGDIL
jgi:hypothetical protein